MSGINEGTGSCLFNTLCHYMDSVVTIFTEGCANTCGYKGLLTDVNCDCVKIVSCNNCNRGRGGCNRYATITVFPIEQITAVTLCNTSF